MNMQELAQYEKDGEYERLIAAVREAVAADRGVFADPWLKGWCGRRWRNIFISLAAEDEAAVATATAKLKLGRDSRPARQRIAERFLKGDALREWDVDMPEALAPPLAKTSMVFAPGLINGVLPVRAFTEEFPRVCKEHGWRILRADCHPMRSCEANMADIDAAVQSGHGEAPDNSRIDPADAEAPGDLFFMGYSKGVPDILTYLVHHPELRDRVRCVINWAGAVGGSYMADDIHENIREMPLESVTQRIDSVLHMIAPELRVEGTLRRMDEWDIKGAIEDLTTWKRAAFMEEHGEAFDALKIPVFNFTGATTVFEVPYFQMRDYMNLAKYDANNDMQVTTEQARVHSRLSVDVAMLRGHHWDLSYGPFPKLQRMGSPNLDHPFPRHAAVEAHFRFLAELGLID